MEGGAVSPFPLLLCRNIYVLPGIPALLQASLCALPARSMRAASPVSLPAGIGRGPKAAPV